MSDGLISRYMRCESGATTVDMAVVMAGVVGLGIATTALVTSSVGDTGLYIEDQMSDMIDSPLDLSSYSLLNPNADDSWRAVLQERVSRFNDNRLNRAYTNTYRRATNGSASRRARQIDRLGVIETEFLARGMTLPDGNQSFADLHAAWIAENG